MTPEGRVKAEIKKFLMRKGVWFAGQHPPPVVTGWMYMPLAGPFGVSGIPDFCGIYVGKPFYVEAKAPGGKPSDLQLRRIAEITKAGGIAVVVESVEQLCAEMDRHGL